MPDSNFNFLKTECPDLGEAANKAEALAFPDPRTACFHARRAPELIAHWLYKHDASLKLPYQENLSALLHEPTFMAPEEIRRGGRSFPNSNPGPFLRATFRVCW